MIKQIPLPNPMPLNHKFKAGIFLYNLGTQQFLIVHSSNSDDIPFWSIPKGDINETESHALQVGMREFCEETNVDLNKLDVNYTYYIGRVTYGRTITRILNTFLFVVDLPENPAVKLDWENDAFMWVDFAAAEELLFDTQLPFLKKTKRVVKLLGDLEKELKREVDKNI